MISGRDFTSKSASSVKSYTEDVSLTIILETNSTAAVWSSLEANVSIICACLAPLHPLLSRIFSFCFRPQPLHSSPASKNQSNSTCLIESRKQSIYDHTPDGGVVFNDFFFSGNGNYSASIAKVNTNEESRETEDGIRVVRELRMDSDSVDPNATLGTCDIRESGQDMEMTEQHESASSGKSTWNPTIEWDLGDFEFPDYKERMNCPL